MRVYCSMSQNFDTFNTPHDALFLVFGVPNAKYLARLMRMLLRIQVIYHLQLQTCIITIISH